MFPSLPLSKYRKYRSAGKRLNHKMLEALGSKHIIEKSAKALGLSKNHTLILDTEDDLSVIMDYALYEIRVNGKNLVQRYQEEIGGASRIERELLVSKAKAKTSLFKVVEVYSRRNQLDLLDLVGCRKITLADINLSQTAVEGTVMFLRLIELPAFTITSGIAFLFAEDMEKTLVKRWAKWKGADRYAKFFKLSKSKGLPIEYV